MHKKISKIKESKIEYRISEEMKCPKCESKTKVMDSRLIEFNRVRRRRRCKECGYRFSTLEVNIEDVIKEVEE